jgi:cyclopropane fatty-acyl-phospholipid synthase-like methyltransferase
VTDDQAGFDPTEHYDRITDPWKLLLGEELHYGVFEQGDEDLPTATAALTARMVEGAQLAAGLRVLDVGCGTGAPACHLVQAHGVEVLGITPSGVGVARANERAAALGLAGATFEARDGTDNGLPDASFDRVWVLESSHLMRERDRLIAECARVLRPGGRVVLCDLIRHRQMSFREVRDRHEDLAVLRAAFGDAHLESLDYYRDAAEANGLVVDRLDDLTQLTLPTFDRWRENAQVNRAEVLGLMSEEDLADFERSTDILEAFWRDGTFGYGLIAAAKPA